MFDCGIYTNMDVGACVSNIRTEKNPLEKHEDKSSLERRGKAMNQAIFIQENPFSQSL
jgi:hypothetical protein